MNEHCSGMNQLLWYYAELEREKCNLLLDARRAEALNQTDNNPYAFEVIKNERDPEGCILWRRFSKYCN